RVARFGPTTPTRASRPSDASVDPTDARNALVPSQPDGVDGGTARAAPEPPRPPVRPRDLPKTELPDRPRAATSADATQGGRRPGSEDGPAALHPSGPPRRDSAGESGVDAPGGGGRCLSLISGSPPVRVGCRV